MSDVGKFLRKKCNERNIPLINIVRKDEQVDALKKEGNKYCLNVTDPLFDKKLKDMAADLNATVAFECVAGDVTGRVFNKLPNNSTMYVYGSLSLKMISEIHPSELIFHQKQIRGFHLVHNFLHDKDLRQFNAELVSDLDKGYISTNYQKEIQLEEVDAALPEYALNLTKGKLLINLSKA
jgi:NADPH2:quinone reductase